MRGSDRSPLVLLVLGVVCAACAREAPTAATAGSPATMAAPASSPTVRITPTSVPTVPPTPASIANYDQRLRATVPIPYPDEIVAAGGYIWVKTDDGHLVAADPASDQVIGDIKVDTTTDPYHYCQGLATDGETIWACSASGDADHKTIDVVRVDPKTKTVVRTVPVDKIFDQFDMPVLGGHIWVLSGDARQLVGIDMETYAVTAPIDLGARCFQLAALEGSLLASCSLENLILQVDPQNGQVTSRVSLPGPRWISVGANAVWVAQEQAVVRLDPITLHPVVAFTGLPSVGVSGDIHATESDVWVRLGNGSLYRIDPATNQLVEQVRSERAYSGGSVLATSDSVWLTAGDDDVLLHLRR